MNVELVSPVEKLTTLQFEILEGDFHYLMLSLKLGNSRTCQGLQSFLQLDDAIFAQAREEMNALGCPTYPFDAHKLSKIGNARVEQCKRYVDDFIAYLYDLKQSKRFFTFDSIADASRVLGLHSGPLCRCIFESIPNAFKESNSRGEYLLTEAGIHYAESLLRKAPRTPLIQPVKAARDAVHGLLVKGIQAIIIILFGIICLIIGATTRDTLWKLLDSMNPYR